MERVKIVWQVALLKARSKERTNADATGFEGTENGRIMVKWKDCLLFVFFPQRAFQKLMYEMGWAGWQETSFLGS